MFIILVQQFVREGYRKYIHATKTTLQQHSQMRPVAAAAVRLSPLRIRIAGALSSHAAGIYNS